MSNKKISPGPWNVRQWRGRADYDLAVVDSDGIVIAEIVDLVNDSKNAAMLASAQDMYEALKNECALCLLRDPEGDCDGCRIGAALKKARGEE